jgi:hypothetical protein
MLIAMAVEIVVADQPISFSIGTIKTPGAERIPAATSNTQKISATMNHP